MKLVFHRSELNAQVLQDDGTLKQEPILLIQGTVLDVQDVVLDETHQTAIIVVSDKITIYEVPMSRFNIVGTNHDTAPNCCN